jgi:two-component system phosphate regulon sensor histidine kinase PhoR
MGGSGLGLAIVKHALQRHGATLRIKSREGAGSTFTCDFPPERIISKLVSPAAAAN